MAEPILRMHHITKEFGGVKALDDVSLTVARGEVHGICGENGAGKSTLMKVLSGVYPHGSYAGEIQLDGEPCSFKDIRSSEAHGIVIIHQELALSPYLSIAENIFLGNEHARGGIISWNETLRHAKELLGRVGLDENPNTRIVDIGVGKQQLVEIAKAISKQVRILILDEPTAALNDEDSRKLLDLIREFKAHGITCIIISHKLNEVLSIADSITVLRDGRTIETLRTAPEDGVGESAGESADGNAGENVFDGTVVDDARLIRSMVGRDLTHRFPDRKAVIGDVAFEIRDWTVHHPIDQQRKVVDGVSLTVRRGEIVGIAGLMGAGRTELAMSVFGRSYGHAISGTVLKDGREIRTRTVPEAISHRIAYVTEDRKRFGLNLIDDIARNISMASLPGLGRAGLVDANLETTVAEKYRRSLKIKATSVRHLTGRLSGGNQQKVVLGKWLNTEPDVLILDEPTRGIDVGAKYEIYTIINDLAAQGKAVVFISSELPELIGMCDRIYALSAGRLTGEVPREHATQEVLMRHMTTGEA